MEVSVPISAFPKFFDGDSCYFLLWVTQKDLELAEYTLRFNKMKETLQKENRSITPRMNVHQH